jgi:2-polyprenyl-6-methoxyphenol hydroxylase-like FAD-dependent oxidoreductase
VNPVVIVGASAGGLATAEALRGKGYESRRTASCAITTKP